MTQDELLREHNILITCFAFDLAGKWAFRFYWKDLSNGHLHNPMIELENSKKAFPYFADHAEGLADAMRSAQEYLESSRKDLGM